MKDLGFFAGSLGFVFLLACGPSQPANTGDDGSTGTPSATASADPGAGASNAGGSSEGGAPPAGGSSEGGAGGTAPTATGGGTSAPVTLAALVGAGDAAAGEKLFEQENCNGCHGTKAKPPAKFPNLFKIKWNDKEYEEAFALVKKGKSPMPGYGDKLNDKQIADIIAFVKK